MYKCGNKHKIEVIIPTKTFSQKNTYMLYPIFFTLDLCAKLRKFKKILTFLHRAMETPRLTWYNLFEYRSTQSSILGQNDQNAPGQPWVDQSLSKSS